MKKPDPEYSVPRNFWADATVRLDELERLWRDGITRIVIHIRRRLSEDTWRNEVHVR
jgi:hypothetical protein